MALSALGEFIGSVVLDALSQTLFYFTGKLLVPVVSLGRWQATGVDASSDKPRPRWRGALVRAADGRRQIGPDGQALLGLSFWVAVALAVIFSYL